MEIYNNRDDISSVKYLILLDIYKSKIKDDITLSELAIKINRKVTNSIFGGVFHNLVQLHIFKYIKSVGSANLYSINYKKLDDFIRQNYLYQRTKEHIILVDPLMYEV